MQKEAILNRYNTPLENQVRLLLTEIT